MKNLIIVAVMCLIAGTPAFAQKNSKNSKNNADVKKTVVKKETAAKDSIVYISNGCKEKTYHNTLYCSKLMKCRHEHQGAAMKDCQNSCPHIGHVVSTSLKEALEQDKKECYVCCKKIKM